MNKKSRISSRLGEKLLRLFMSSDDAESIAGDLEENYSDFFLSRRRFLASGWYWAQILKSVLGAVSFWFTWNLSLLKTYTKFTWRNIRRQKIYSFVSITGLGVGMAACILILLWVHHERSYDRFHENYARLHRVILNSGDGKYHSPATVGLIADYLEKEYPDIVLASNLGRTEYKLTHRTHTFISIGLLVNPGFLEMFTFPLKEGDPHTAFEEPNSMVITEKLAHMFFGEGPFLGKTIWVEDRNPFKVTGVVVDVPANSSIQFDYLLPYLTLRSNRDQWNWRDTHESYVLLQKTSSHEDVSQKIVNVFNDQNQRTEIQDLSLQPLARVPYSIRRAGGSSPMSTSSPSWR